MKCDKGHQLLLRIVLHANQFQTSFFSCEEIYVILRAQQSKISESGIVSVLEAARSSKQMKMKRRSGGCDIIILYYWHYFVTHSSSLQSEVLSKLSVATASFIAVDSHNNSAAICCY